MSEEESKKRRRRARVSISNLEENKGQTSQTDSCQSLVSHETLCVASQSSVSREAFSIWPRDQWIQFSMTCECCVNSPHLRYRLLTSLDLAQYLVTTYLSWKLFTLSISKNLGARAWISENGIQTTCRWIACRKISHLSYSSFFSQILINSKVLQDDVFIFSFLLDHD